MAPAIPGSEQESAQGAPPIQAELAASLRARQLLGLIVFTDGSAQNNESSSESQPLFEVSDYGDGSVSPISAAHATPPSFDSSHRDPTLPQFRPSSVPAPTPAPMPAPPVTELDVPIKKEDVTNHIDYSSSSLVFDPNGKDFNNFTPLDKCNSVRD